MRTQTQKRTFALGLCLALAVGSTALADPCGMVPPIYQGQGPPIVRIGQQQTYVFYKDGVETFVIRPGFSGKVDEFGMLIPFPTPPSVRKVPDHIFPHVAAAVDPPEVVVDLRPRKKFSQMRSRNGGAKPADGRLGFRRPEEDEVRVLRKEAVGMYEVAVLEAGSAAALKKWMDQHGYRYPDGMDKVCEEYVDDEWCFVAVKTKVGQKEGVDPKPGQRTITSQLPSGSNFDGFVQAMGFRFKTDELVVPMRLSAFNEGELRNIVYVLTDGPRRIRSIPEEYVVRQIAGNQLLANVTDPLPVRILGGTERDLTDGHRNWLKTQRNPTPKNGAARELFAADLFSVASGQLSLPHEEQEKELLSVGEHFGLRGNEIDKLNAAALRQEAETTIKDALADLESMTLSVVDGDFPREVLGGQNLTFAAFQMPRRRNNPRAYDSKLNGPGPKLEGVLKLGRFAPPAAAVSQTNRPAWWSIALAILLVGIVALRSRSSARIYRGNHHDH